MIGLVLSSNGYAPAVRPTQSLTTPQRAAVSTSVRMNVAGGDQARCSNVEHNHPREAAHSGLLTLATGTETVDFTLGKIRTQRDVVDDQMRPRPDIEWLELRKTLETKFGISDADLKKYDEIPADAVEAACAPPHPTRRRG